MNDYDYLIVGAGPFGCTFARLALEAGKRSLIIEKQEHIGGNCYTEKRDGIHVHLFGPHVFHTNSEKVWQFVNRFARFHPYQHRVLADYGGKLYSLPFSFQTLYEFSGLISPSALEEWLRSEITDSSPESGDCESHALKTIGRSLYTALVEGYTQKQWGVHPRDLPSSILKRIPLRRNFGINYFDDRYQGIPIEGYTDLFTKMVDGVEIKHGVDFADIESRKHFTGLARRVIYTGALDDLYDAGPLQWRCLKFEHQRIDTQNYQGTAVINYPASDVPWTRITEHKHFLPMQSEQSYTWITREFSFESGYSKAYPVVSEKNRRLHATYIERAQADGYIIGGRLAEYRYYDMHQVIASAMSTFERLNA